jgi:hypothetical protein
MKTSHLLEFLWLSLKIKALSFALERIYLLLLLYQGPKKEDIINYNGSFYHALIFFGLVWIIY